MTEMVDTGAEEVARLADLTAGVAKRLAGGEAFAIRPERRPDLDMDLILTRAAGTLLALRADLTDTLNRLAGARKQRNRLRQIAERGARKTKARVIAAVDRRDAADGGDTKRALALAAMARADLAVARAAADAEKVRAERAEGVLAKAAERFEEYADLHAAKGTEDGDRKAQTNRDMAAMCRAPPDQEAERQAQAAA